MSDQSTDHAPEPVAERRPSRRLIAGLLLLIAVICAVTLMVFARNGLPEMIVAPALGLVATLLLVGGIWFAVETVIRKDIGAGLPDDED